MTEILLAVILVVLLPVAVLLVAMWRRMEGFGPSVMKAGFDTVGSGQERVERSLREEIARNREESATSGRALREETAASMATVSQSIEQKLETIRVESTAAAKQSREEVALALKGFNDSILKSMLELTTLQKSQMEGVATEIAKLTEANAKALAEVRAVVEAKLAQMQADNSIKLEEMRKTVDEKLQGTLEKRLGESFKLVSERLEQVHKGLGEMQTLASGVGDLKKVLTNVKARGTWGEMQLGNLLEQILSPGQYAANVSTKRMSQERVEFAIKLPGREAAGDAPVWLPIDAKFPREDYERLIEAADRADVAAVEESAKQLETRIKAEAKDIRDKYLDPPNTTDFGILFLPVEGLYAEVLRRPGLVEALQRDYRVNVAGPTTLAALLNSLQMGFRTLAIQQRSSEVWALLGAVKTEFGKFGEVINKVHKKLQEATNAVDGAATRSRAIERKLRDVQEVPAAAAHALLGAIDGAGEEVEEPEVTEAG